MITKKGFILGVVAIFTVKNLFQGADLLGLHRSCGIHTTFSNEQTSHAVLGNDSIHTNENANAVLIPPAAPEEHTTSIILVSNLVAVHPDINMTVGVLDSLAFYTCIYISIDGLAD